MKTVLNDSFKTEAEFSKQGKLGFLEASPRGEAVERSETDEV